jgi:membrane protease YdiL (CAAX protease family)
MGTAAIQSKMEEDRLVAPIWHTILYFALWGALAFGVKTARPEEHRALFHFAYVNRSWIYLFGFAAEAVIFGLMYLGLRFRKTKLAELVGHGADRNELRRDIVAGALFSLVLLGVSALLLLTFPPHKETIDISPRTLPQFFFFFLMLVSAGFFEELIFRGYLFRQLSHYISIDSAVVIQAIVFAVVHGPDQSVGELASKFVVGGFLGFLAVQRKSLLPGMIAHGCLNGIAAVILGLSRLAG